MIFETDPTIDSIHGTHYRILTNEKDLLNVVIAYARKLERLPKEPFKAKLIILPKSESIRRIEITSNKTEIINHDK